MINKHYILIYFSYICGMENKKKIVYTNLPEEIKGFLLITQGWLVGNSIKDIIDCNTPKDYDIIIPNRELFQVITKNWTNSYTFKINTFGGIKITIGEIVIDFWCEELSHFLSTANKVSYLYNLKHNILLENI